MEDGRSQGRGKAIATTRSRRQTSFLPREYFRQIYKLLPPTLVLGSRLGKALSDLRVSNIVVSRLSDARFSLKSPIKAL